MGRERLTMEILLERTFRKSRSISAPKLRMCSPRNDLVFSNKAILCVIFSCKCVLIAAWFCFCSMLLALIEIEFVLGAYKVLYRYTVRLRA